MNRAPWSINTSIEPAKCSECPALYNGNSCIVQGFIIRDIDAKPQYCKVVIDMQSEYSVAEGTQ